MKYKKHAKIDGKNELALLKDFMEGIRQACAAASVMGTFLKRPEFWQISNTLRDVNILAPDIARRSMRWADPDIKTYMSMKTAASKPLITTAEPAAQPTKLITEGIN
jgi:hypothetical protein